MTKMKKIGGRDLLFLAACGLLLASCAGTMYPADRPAAAFLEHYRTGAPISPGGFAVCNHYDCEGGGAEVRLTAEEWQRVRNLFASQTTAAGERDRIAEAIGLMESLVGRQANTFADQACNGYREPIVGYQLDCIAETANTTVYLLLLEQEGLLRWHRVGYPASRSFALLFFPHNTAVIRETDGNRLYAVDSWYYANGEKATVVPLDQWFSFYAPAPCT